MILLGIAFIAGVLTVLAPCTISLLPVIVGGSISEGRSIRRALTVTSSLGISVVLFTLILKVSTAFIHIPQEFWQILSGIIIFLLGLSMVFPALYEKLPWVNKLNQSSNKMLATGYNKKSFWGDVTIGAALGPVFSSCSPTYFLIIATVLPRSLGAGIVYLLAYAIGLSGALLLVAFAGQKLMQKLGVASDPRGWIKRIIGILFVLIGIAIGFGFDKKLETGITNAGYFDVTKVEQKLLEKSAAESKTSMKEASVVSDAVAKMSGDRSHILMQKAKMYEQYHEITNPSGFINTDGKPIKISDYIGKKVVLIDFWTYSCINCQRTLPYLKTWYDTYSDKGLEIISIHTPEFGFEKVQANVEKAAKGFGLKYPIVLDNEYGTWNAFQNQYWPRKYLIDIDGYIVYDHAGEGNYDVTEAAIQKALAERAKVLGDDTKIGTSMTAPSGVVTVDASALGSPETYFGSSRNEYLANGKQGAIGTQVLSTPEPIGMNRLYLSGSWNFSPEFAEAGTGSIITYKYKAKNVYFVASSTSGTSVRIQIDGKEPGAMAGSDVSPDGTLQIKDNRLYSIVSGADYKTHTITIETLGPGLDAYTFTFG